jgi:hypothetical protein
MCGLAPAQADLSGEFERVESLQKNTSMFARRIRKPRSVAAGGASVRPRRAGHGLVRQQEGYLVPDRIDRETERTEQPFVRAAPYFLKGSAAYRTGQQVEQPFIHQRFSVMRCLLFSPEIGKYRPQGRYAAEGCVW